MQPEVGTPLAGTEREAPVTAPTGRPISIDAVAFDVVLLVFCLALLLAMPSSAAARLVPLLVLVPTLLGVAYQLYVDLTPGRHLDRTTTVPEASPEVSGEVRRRQLLFVGWVLAFLVAAWLTNFLVVIPVALFVILRLANGESLPLTVALTAGMSATIYVLFGLVLGVRF